MEFKDRLKELREEFKKDRYELAKFLNVSYSTIAKYESGLRSPDKETLNKLANYFNVSVDYLLGRTDIRNAFIPEEYAKKYKVTKRDLLQYEDFIQHAGAFFMNDEVAEEDKEKLFRDISELFWKAKETNKEKYDKKKKKQSSN